MKLKDAVKILQEKAKAYNNGNCHAGEVNTWANIVQALALTSIADTKGSEVFGSTGVYDV